MNPSRLIFVDETGAATNMARRHGRSPRGQRLDGPIPHSEQDAARDRVLPCVRPLLRHGHGRGPVWEFGDQVHLTGTRSKRYPCAWFS
jgi:hypothetical protein